MAALQEDLATSADQGGAQLAIYIHGLANTFADAITETATLATNLAQQGVPNYPRYTGVVLGFSWPSFGIVDSVLDYSAIRQNIQGSVSSFASVLQIVQELKRAMPVNVSLLCHSEGNYMLMRGMAALSLPGWQNIDQVIMLAADINDAALQLPDGEYVGWGAAIARLANRVTIYSSIWDPDLAFSALAYAEDHNPQYPARLGMVGPWSFAAGALAPITFGVDCARVVNDANLGWLKWERAVPWSVMLHSSYLYIPQILTDMVQTMTGIAAGSVINRTTLEEPDNQAFEMQIDSHFAPEPREPAPMRASTLVARVPRSIDSLRGPKS